MSSAKVMVVEDEGIVSIDIRNILQQLGYHVAESAFSGEEALEKIESDFPDLILMDIGLKGELDGIEVARIVHENFKIPVIFVTGFADETTIKRAKAVKPVGYLIKPINEEELESALVKALS